MELSYHARSGAGDRPVMLTPPGSGGGAGGGGAGGGGGGGGGEGGGVTRRGGYARLGEDGGAGGDDARAGGMPAGMRASAMSVMEEARRRRRATAERINNKIHAAFWVLVAGLTLRYGGVVEALQHDDSVMMGFMGVGFAAVGVVLSIMVYLTLYLPHVRHVYTDWNDYDPRMIPTATAAGVVAVLCFLVGLWPVYGLLTPAIIAVLFMGSIMVLHFIPYC